MKEKIKLIASDLDGTLLPEGTKDINPEIYEIIRRLHEKGITFAAASGRDLETMVVVLEPVKELIYGISNNGGRVAERMSENKSVLTLDWELVKRVIEEVRSDENCEFVSVNTLEGTFTDSKNREIIDWLINGYGLKPVIVDDMISRPLEVMKISLFMKSDAGKHVGPYIEKYGKLAHVTAAGERWIDFTHSDADKGLAFKNLIDMLGIKKEETWAFGDNNNDISMLQAAGRGFAAPGARKEVTEAADECLDGTLWDAVVNKLKELL